MSPALILIDLQKAIDDPSWGVRNNPGAEANVTRLLEVWREKSRPVYHVRHEDACFTFARLDWEGRPRSAAEVHAMSLANFRGEYCTVVTTQEILQTGISVE